jgi:molybdenum cofactor cytidylyltransferase
VIFTLVDHPLVEPRTVAVLAESDAAFAVATYNGKRGHPIAFDGSLIPEFLAAGPGDSARDVRERHATGVAYLETGDRGVVADIDDPAAYDRFIGAVTP